MKRAASVAEAALNCGTAVGSVVPARAKRSDDSRDGHSIAVRRSSSVRGLSPELPGHTARGESPIRIGSRPEHLAVPRSGP